MRLLFVSLAILTGIISCKKDQNAKMDIQSVLQCSQSQNLDSVAIANKLIGSWKWIRQNCFWTGNRPIDKVIKVRFRNDQTFSVYEGSIPLTQGTWKLRRMLTADWGLNLSSHSKYLVGLIRFCDNYVLFLDSYRDGCDNLFVKFSWRILNAPR